MPIRRPNLVALFVVAFAIALALGLVLDAYAQTPTQVGPPGAPGSPERLLRNSGHRLKLEEPFPREARPSAFIPFELDGGDHVTLDILGSDGSRELTRPLPLLG